MRVRVARDDPRGRYLEAVASAVPGDVLLREDPVAMVPHLAMRDTTCDQCLRPLPSTSYRCSSCKTPRYCGADCQRTAWKAHHKRECGTLLKLHEEGKEVTPLLLLAYRMLHALGEKDQAELVSHIPRDREEEFNLLTDLLLHLISTDPALSSTIGTGCEAASSARKLLGRIQANAFDITDDDNTKVAYGVFLTASAMNHSCSNNAVVVFRGPSLEVRAVRPIQPKEEVVISYIPLEYSADLRQRELALHYGFTCTCPRCLSGDWERLLKTCTVAEKEEEISRALEKGELADALRIAEGLTEQLNVFDCQLDAPSVFSASGGAGRVVYHPHVAIHFFRLARLRWAFNDAAGASEAASVAAEQVRVVAGTESPFHREVESFIAQLR